MARSDEDAKKILETYRPAFRQLFKPIASDLHEYLKAFEKYEQSKKSVQEFESDLSEIRSRFSRINEEMYRTVQKILKEDFSSEGSNGDWSTDDENHNSDQPQK